MDERKDERWVEHPIISERSKERKCVFSHPAIKAKLGIFAYVLILPRRVQLKEAKTKKKFGYGQEKKKKKSKLAHAGYRGQQAKACPSYPSHVTHLLSFYSHNLVIENSAFNENIKRLEPRLYQDNISLLLHAHLSRGPIFPVCSSASLSKHYLFLCVCACVYVYARVYAHTYL